MSASASASTGGTWKGLVYFDPAADKPGDPEEITNDELREKLRSMIDPSEKIVSVSLVKTPLWETQWTNALAYHVFVYFRTTNYLWSIEKNSQGITIQRSQSEFDKFAKGNSAVAVAAVAVSAVVSGQIQLTAAELMAIMVMMSKNYVESQGAVVNKYRQQLRCKTGYWKPQLIMQDESNKSMSDVVDFLYDSGALNTPYHGLTANCKHFAEGFFNEFAATKKWT